MDRNQIIQIVKNGGFQLKFVLNYQDDNEIMEGAVSQNGALFEYASHRLKQNSEIILKATKNFPFAFTYIPNNLQTNYDLVYLIVQNNVKTLQFVTENIENYKQLVLMAVALDGEALQFTSKALQDDFDVVGRAALNNNPRAIRWASKRIKNNKKIMEKLVQNDGLCLSHASSRLMNDLDLALKAIIQNAYAIDYVSPRIRNKLDQYKKKYQKIQFKNYKHDYVQILYSDLAKCLLNDINIQKAKRKMKYLVQKNITKNNLVIPVFDRQQL